jgi:hypothetical protein
MGNSWKYWNFSRIDAAGTCKTQPIAEAQAFFQTQFPTLVELEDIPNALVQFQLMQRLQSAPLSDRQLAESCLRCFISQQIKQTCLDLAQKFGQSGRFHPSDLLPLVLNDVGMTQPLTIAAEASTTQPLYQPLAAKILRTFDPEKSSLSTWTKQLVEHDKELNAFLQEQGIWLISDWAILNAATPKRIQRRLASGLSESELQMFCGLLRAYHQVYRRDRQLDPKQRGQKCETPTSEQLREIAKLLQANGFPKAAPLQVLTDLRSLAQQLRQTKSPSLDPLDEQQADQQIAPSSDPEAQDMFLKTYLQEVSDCLDRAIETTVETRLANHRRKKPPTDRKFLRALFLFYCQCQSMGKIAQRVELKQQYQVTRLIGRKALEEDICRETLVQMQDDDRIRSKMAEYLNLDRLISLSQALEAALNRMLAEANAEANNPRRTSSTLLAMRLCRYLNRLSGQDAHLKNF